MDKPPRQLIREAVVDRLKASRVVDGETLYATPAGARVYPARTLPTRNKILPALLVYDGPEKTVEEPVVGIFRRELVLAVEMQATNADPEDLEAILDAGAWAVELVVMADPKQGGHAEKTALALVEKEREWKGANLLGAVWVIFTVTYTASPMEEPTDLDDFLVFHADIDAAPPDGQVDAVAHVTYPAPEAPEEG